jgi:Ca2+-binding EF-hand superfamily protein
MDKYPSGLISKQDFIIENMEFTHFGNNILWGHIFDIIDSDLSGQISFVEWVSLLSCINRGSKCEQLEREFPNKKFTFELVLILHCCCIWKFSVCSLIVMFRLYDSDNDGFLGRGEVLQIVKFLNRLREYPDRSPEEVTDHAFQILDLNHDGKISLEEFEVGMHSDPEVAKQLNVLEAAFKGYRQMTLEEARAEIELYGLSAVPPAGGSHKKRIRSHTVM